ncbi:DNA-3-methyladenine glycosylase I [Afifella sp. IM 167]|uniref:DNA-3-methyladenine glycosylase I n=1 Tax=Afifella sp. IM 167 TaxID=2033586 RepID=UPI001CD00273|nr:DNA-3-methyladenine glycosylase I [Afifella sp. IM 167]MBZ8133498.1 DNA-3-methyladenine glycosylase I [Afifella sp. IM 167]
MAAAEKQEKPGIGPGADGRPRCFWCLGDPLYEGYHDEEWGRPSADDRRLFEKLCLEGFQSGLSWLTILRKRENFRRAFAGFDMEKVAAFGEADVERLVADAGIIRHRGKIVSAINNARRVRELREEAGSLAAFVWSFEPQEHRRPGRFDRETLMKLAHTEESAALSKALKKRGWSFVGPTTVYAFMQAMGLVNDHIEGCVHREASEKARAAFARPV